MRDKLGNRITEGNLLWWLFPEQIAKGGLIFSVVRVSESKLAVAGGDPPPPILTLQIDVPVNAQRGQEPRLGEFMRVVDPRQEAALDALASRGDGTIKERTQ